MSGPEIAVVIPTRQREARLAFALEALGEQTLDRDRFEVIVVRSGDTPPPHAQVPDGLPARVLTGEGTGSPSHHRNLGWRASTAPLVVFTDDDCRPSPGWLEGLVTAATGEAAGDGTRPALVLQGRTEPDPDETHLLHGLARSQRITTADDVFQACNVAFSRRLLEQLGGYEEAFSFGGEDTDLGLRALEAGARWLYVDGALTWHAVLVRTLPSIAQEAGKWTSVPLLFKRHPELRRRIYARFFWKEAHAKLLLAACGALMLRRNKLLGAAAIAPYVLMYMDAESLRPVRPRRLARHLIWMAGRAFVDSTEVVSTTRGAIRYRAPLI